MTLFLDFEGLRRFSQAKINNKCVCMSVCGSVWMYACVCVCQAVDKAAQYGRKRKALLTQNRVLVDARDWW